MSRLILFLGLTAFSLLLHNCNPQDRLEIEKSAQLFDIEQGRASILQSNKRLMKALEHGDSVEAASTYTSNAKVMANNMAEVAGRDKIVKFIGSKLNTGIRNLELEMIEIWGDSSLLAEEGRYTFLDSNADARDKGNYIVLWKLEGGNWKRFRQIWASDLPKTAPEAKKP